MGAMSWEQLQRRAYEFRNKPTPTENYAICKLNERGDKYYQFQKAFGFYILDFIIPSKLLVVELDGNEHEDNKIYDARRDKFCNDCGLKVLRLKNNQAASILKAIEAYPNVINWEFKLKRAFAIAKQRRTDSELAQAYGPLTNSKHKTKRKSDSSPLDKKGKPLYFRW